MTENKYSLEKAIALAVEAHKGQLDKVGQPYILHPLRVMLAQKTTIAKIVGVLHDVIEDTAVTMESLRALGFPPEVLEPLSLVTAIEGEDYQTFIQRAKSHPVARRVKIADLLDNMDVTRLPEVNERDRKRLSKYILALKTLEAADQG